MRAVLIIVITIFFMACNNTHHKEAPKPAVTTMPVSHKDTAMMKLTFDSKKDLVCGMPVSAGITDTVHYKNKLYGFCSAGCKEEFLKNPETVIKMKE